MPTPRARNRHSNGTHRIERVVGLQFQAGWSPSYTNILEVGVNCGVVGDEGLAQVFREKSCPTADFPRGLVLSGGNQDALSLVITDPVLLRFVKAGKWAGVPLRMQIQPKKCRGFLMPPSVDGWLARAVLATNATVSGYHVASKLTLMTFADGTEVLLVFPQHASTLEIAGQRLRAEQVQNPHRNDGRSSYRLVPRADTKEV